MAPGGAFYGVAAHTHTRGLLGVPGWQHLPLGVAAQAVQHPAYPTLYNRWEPDARALTQWLWSGSAGVIDCTGTTGPAQVSGAWANPIAPAPYTIGSPFGMRFDPVNGRWSLHRGQDLAVPTGTPDRAACDGVIARTDPADPYGGGMQTDLDCGGGIVIKYMHQSAFTVHTGATPSQPGRSSATPAARVIPPAPHLHLQIDIDGQATDPIPSCASAASDCDANGPGAIHRVPTSLSLWWDSRKSN